MADASGLAIGTSVPPIPDPLANLQSLVTTVKALRQGVQSLAGVRGNTLDRAVTWNDLLALDLSSGGSSDAIAAEALIRASADVHEAATRAAADASETAARAAADVAIGATATTALADAVLALNEIAALPSSVHSVILAGGLFLNAGTAGGTITNTGTISVGEFANPQTATTYAIVDADLAKWTTFSNAAPVAVTIGQAGAGGNFLNGWWEVVQNTGTGLVTLTPATSKIDGIAAMNLQTWQGARIESDGTNFFALLGSPLHVLPNNALSTRLPDSGAYGGNARGDHAIDIQPYGVIGQVATNVASGGNSIALGFRITATGTFAMAGGYGASALGGSDLAWGANASASGGGASAFGSQASAGASGLAAGQQSTAGFTAVALGFLASAPNTNGVAIGRSTSVAGTNSAACGSGNTLTATTNSYALGTGLADRGNIGAILSGSASSNKQVEEYCFTNTTTAAAAVRLTTDNTSAGAFNVAALANNSAMAFTASFIIRDVTTGKSITYTQGLSLIERGASAATTAISASNPAMVAGPASAAPFVLAAAPTIAADTTNGGLNIGFTPPVGNTDTLHASCLISIIYQT